VNRSCAVARGSNLSVRRGERTGRIANKCSYLDSTNAAIWTLKKLPEAWRYLMERYERSSIVLHFSGSRAEFVPDVVRFGYSAGIVLKSDVVFRNDETAAETMRLLVDLHKAG
jgi:hypothetical protein